MPARKRVFAFWKEIPGCDEASVHPKRRRICYFWPQWNYDEGQHKIPEKDLHHLVMRSFEFM